MFEQSCLADNVKLSASREATHANYVYIQIWCVLFFVCLIFLGKVTFHDGRHSRKSSQVISFSPSKLSDESL